jgi:hypothetical protein
VARGWESKSVEDQQAAASTPPESKQRLTPQQVDTKQKEEAILLSRSHVLQQMQKAENPRHRQMLQDALAALDAQLTRLG